MDVYRILQSEPFVGRSDAIASSSTFESDIGPALNKNATFGSDPPVDFTIDENDVLRLEKGEFWTLKHFKDASHGKKSIAWINSAGNMIWSQNNEKSEGLDLWVEENITNAHQVTWGASGTTVNWNHI